MKNLIKTLKDKTGPNANGGKYFREQLTDLLSKNFEEEHHGIYSGYHGYSYSLSLAEDYADLPDCYIKRKSNRKGYILILAHPQVHM